MNTDNTLKAVIDKYKLSDPVSAEIRLAMEKSRRDNLAMILKKDAYSALFISAVVSFFMWIKKFGITVSITKSAVAVSAALIIGACAVTAVGVYTVKNVSAHLSDEKQKIESIQSGSIVKPVVTAVPEIFSYNVAVSPVEMDDVTDDLLSEYRNKMILELGNIRGSKAAINIEKLNGNHITGKILSISIIKLKEQMKESGDKSPYRISARIINAVNSQVLMYSSVTAESESTIPDSLSELALKISGKL